MKYILVIFLFLLIGCSKQEKSPGLNVDSNKIKTDSVQHTYPVPKPSLNTYKKGDPIELYDLINILLPDENTKGKYMDWGYLDNYKDLFTVSAGEYDINFSKGYEKYGEIQNHSLIVPSKKGVKKEILDIMRFIGSETGYNRFEIYAASCIKFEEYDLVSLFNKKEYAAKIIGDCEDESKKQSDLYCDYEIKFPGKKPFGLAISGSQCGGRNHFGDDMIVRCFLNVDEAKSN